jgi:peroxiredoxin
MLKLVGTLLIVFAPAASAISIKKEAERKRAPNFELNDQAGQVVRLADYAGKVVLLDFWATWCVPCKASMPWFNEFVKQYDPVGFAVIGVSMDGGGWDTVRPFIEKMGITYPIVLGTKRVAYLYGDVEELPLAFLIDREQRVAAIHSGAASRKEFEKAVRALLQSPRGRR